MTLFKTIFSPFLSHSFADLDDALLDSFNGTGSYGYELEDILEELKHSNSTVALNEIMGAVEDKER